MKVRPIERVEHPSVDELRRHYLSRNRPVIIEGAADEWLARSECSPRVLKDSFGDLVVNVRGSDNEFDVFFGNVPSKTMRLGEYIDLICSNEFSGERPPYFGNVSLSRSKVQAFADYLRTNFSFPPYFENQAGEEVRIWLGASGQRSIIHNDNYHNLNAQMFGRKEFLLFAPEQHQFLYTRHFSKSCWVSPVDPQSPDLQRYPLFRGAEGYGGVLEAGDMLFIPIFWWHQARALTTCININSWVYTGKVEYWQQHPEIARHADVQNPRGPRNNHAGDD